MSALPAVIKRDIDRWTYEMYMTNAIQVLAENTAVPAASFSEGKLGKTIPLRWADMGKPAPPEETRTAEDVIEHVKIKLQEVSRN